MAAVLVHIDLVDDQPHPASLAALAAGRSLASSWGAVLYAALIVRAPADAAPEAAAAPTTDRTAPMRAPTAQAGALELGQTGEPLLPHVRAELAAAGADKIVFAVTEHDPSPLWAHLGPAWQVILDHLRPRLVLFGADAPATVELGPRTGARIGARLLRRARPIAGELVELRDRDGRYARATDGGATVALIGSAPARPAIPPPRGFDPVEVLILAAAGAPDDRVAVIATGDAEPPPTRGAVIVLGDDAAADPAVVRDANGLARALGGAVIGSPEAVRRGAIADDAVIERGAALAPDLCVQIGALPLDLAGASCVVRIGGAARAETAAPHGGSLPSGRSVDAAIAGPVGAALAELVAHLELA